MYHDKFRPDKNLVQRYVRHCNLQGAQNVSYPQGLYRRLFRVTDGGRVLSHCHEQSHFQCNDIIVMIAVLSTVVIKLCRSVQLISI